MVSRNRYAHRPTQWSARAAWRLRLASIQAEFKPERTMTGHKKAQTVAKKNALGPCGAILGCFGFVGAFAENMATRGSQEMA